MSYLEELLSEFRKGAKIRRKGWGKEKYICFKDGIIYGEENLIVPYSINACSNWFFETDWEVYEEPIDWDYIIKNKCLCWFWDGREEYRVAGILGGYQQDEPDFRFKMKNMDENAVFYQHCRPVRRDEVTFYEDKR